MMKVMKSSMKPIPHVDDKTYTGAGAGAALEEALTSGDWLVDNAMLPEQQTQQQTHDVTREARAVTPLKSVEHLLTRMEVYIHTYIHTYLY